MAHTKKDKKKLLIRVRRIIGQMQGVANGLEEDIECEEVLRQISSARGAMNGLMYEIIQGYLNEHVLDPDIQHNSKQAEASQHLMSILKSYLK